MWLYNLVSNSKIKSHSLHYSDKCFVRKPNEYLLKKHTQQHIESICVICKKKFNARKDLKRHTGTWYRYMKCKGVKNVGNGSAVRKSSERTDKSTKSI